MNRLGIGYSCLNNDEKKAYEIIEESLNRKSSSCDISSVKKRIDIGKIYEAVLGDHPEIIYVNCTFFQQSESLFERKLIYSIVLKGRKAQDCEKELQDAVESAAWEIDKKAKNDRDILLGISEYLQKNVIYDNEERDHSVRGKSRSPMAHTAYGALVNHKAVCDGFSKAYAILCQYFGIKCMVVNGRSAFRNSPKVEHAWNIVEFEGKNYHIDSTWDSNVYRDLGVHSYDYFGLDDDEISIEHDWDYTKTPICNSTKLSYFLYNALYANFESQITDILVRQWKRNEKCLRVKISPKIFLSNDEKRQIHKIMDEAAGRSGFYGKYRYSWEEQMRILIIILE